jgi:hypothetical protein
MIRPFRPDDAAGVAAVILPIQREEFGIPITLEEQPDLLDIAGFYQQGDGNFWVAVCDETVVGTIGLLDIGNRRGGRAPELPSRGQPGFALRRAQPVTTQLRPRCLAS